MDTTNTDAVPWQDRATESYDPWKRYLLERGYNITIKKPNGLKMVRVQQHVVFHLLSTSYDLTTLLLVPIFILNQMRIISLVDPNCEQTLAKSPHAKTVLESDVDTIGGLHKHYKKQASNIDVKKYERIRTDNNRHLPRSRDVQHQIYIPIDPDPLAGGGMYRALGAKGNDEESKKLLGLPIIPVKRLILFIMSNKILWACTTMK